MSAIPFVELEIAHWANGPYIKSFKGEGAVEVWNKETNQLELLTFERVPLTPDLPSNELIGRRFITPRWAKLVNGIAYPILFTVKTINTFHFMVEDYGGHFCGICLIEIQ